MAILKVKQVTYDRAKKVSVIVVNYKGMPHVDSCLSSVLNQTYPNFEVIFVDNDSNDGSLEHVKSKFPHLIFVVNDRNLGYAGGINSGLQYASGDYIAPLNIDTEVDENWLAPMANFLDLNPEVGAVTPKILLYNDRTKGNALGLNIHVSGLGFVRGLNKEDSNFPNIPTKVAGVSGCSFLIRRQLLERIYSVNKDNFNFMYYDDVDLSWLINLMGYEIYCVPQSVIYHKYELEMPPEKLFLLEYGRLSLLVRYLSWFTFILFLPLFALTELLVIGYSTVRGRKFISAKLRSVILVIKNIRQLMNGRRQAQRLRRISDFQLFKRLQLNYEWSQFLAILK